MIVSHGYVAFVCIDSMLWDKKCRSYMGSNLGGFWAITPERLGIQHAEFACS